ncbi:MAG: cyclic nucleotide-binding domain-containing protein [Actinomycetota bacterium]|nr:cyclic nucleotide-binding domain-containing protein [Actinomycetota bacterium]
MSGAPTELLAKVKLFSDLDPRELKEIAGAMNEISYVPGQVVLSEGAGGVGFFIIAEGKAKVTVEGGDVRALGPGDYFGEIALIADTRRSATVTAETPLTCWGLASWAFRPIVASNSSIAWKLLQALARLLSDR